MNNITRITAAALLTMASVAAFAQSASETAARDNANMSAGDNYPVVAYHNTQSRADVQADLVKAQREGLIANGDDYPVTPRQATTQPHGAGKVDIAASGQGLDSSLYSGA
ncbi:DUF4148 domain-containing protein [Herbaspirillum sp. RV1423]|uniref:DUF4148 domain-containing protein n=1 Tax=Herbaspirillum sp. RV1423 TaxID=1443993 RepID=UPI0004BA48EA|nr:DUF4148 domain-containing protein [Herbaspirillum sp. RV1423]